MAGFAFAQVDVAGYYESGITMASDLANAINSSISFVSADHLQATTSVNITWLSGGVVSSAPAIFDGAYPLVPGTVLDITHAGVSAAPAGNYVVADLNNLDSPVGYVPIA